MKTRKKKKMIFFQKNELSAKLYQFDFSLILV